MNAKRFKSIIQSRKVRFIETERLVDEDGNITLCGFIAKRHKR